MKKNITKTEQEREAIVAEYLLGHTSYRELGKKHGIDFRAIHSWVTKFQGKPLRKQKPKQAIEVTKTVNIPTEIKQLQEELRKAKLYNELLNAMIDIAEDQLKIDIRKKSGTKR
jgi:transposase-like protein